MCLYAFRNNLIAQARETILLNYTKEKLNSLPKDDPGGWVGLTLFPKKLSLIHAIRNQSFEADFTTDFSTLPAEPVNPYKTDTDEITYNTDGLLSVNTARFTGISGFLNNFENTNTGSLSLVSANDFGTVTWLSLTDDSLPASARSLITISSKLQNTGMTWDGTTTIHNNWGAAPTQVFPLNITLNLKMYADSIHVYPLDKTGKENLNSFLTYLPTSGNNFLITLNQNVYKTLWFGIEKFGNGNINSLKDETNNSIDYKLEQNFPNPFNKSTVIFYSIAHDSNVKLEIFDALGSKVKTLADKYMPAGTFSATWNGNNDSGTDLVSGIYFLKFTSGNFNDIKKLILLK